MLEIDFINHTTINIENYRNLVAGLLENSSKILNLPNVLLTLSIEFIQDEQALELNKKYQDKDYVPDVLSFPTKMNKKEVLAVAFWELGDIFICFPEAQRKAIKYNHSIELEIAFLIVHGFLHLLGFDHDRGLSQEREMFAWQDKILASAGYKYTIQKN